MSHAETDLAQELLAAITSGGTADLPSARDPEFHLQTAYAVEAELVRLRGRKTTGLKVGYANKAMWRALKLETLVWAHMYDDSVHYSTPELALPYYRSPKIEPEIVFKLKGAPDPASVLDSVEWLAVGFEIIDCPFPDWQFKPADFVAAGGLHLALVVGEPVPPRPSMLEQLAQFKVRLFRDGEFIEEGSGKNSLRSPALCLAELATRTSLSAGDLVSSGTLTSGQPIKKGEKWRVEIQDLPISGLDLFFT